jgi:hypothetical protein
MKNNKSIHDILDDVLELVYMAGLLEEEINYMDHGRKGVIRSQIIEIKKLAEKIRQSAEIMSEQTLRKE